MIWSSFCNSGYAVGSARSVTGEITGPWTVDSEPIYSLDGGHPMLFRSFEEKLMMVLHSPNGGVKERMLIFEMDELDGRLYTRHEITGNWYSKFYYPDGRMITI
jgi:arabinan endo-1,5-alpha-L-arabinosidase